MRNGKILCPDCGSLTRVLRLQDGRRTRECTGDEPHRFLTVELFVGYPREWRGREREARGEGQALTRNTKTLCPDCNSPSRVLRLDTVGRRGRECDGAEAHRFVTQEMVVGRPRSWSQTARAARPGGQHLQHFLTAQARPAVES